MAALLFFDAVAQTVRAEKAFNMLFLFGTARLKKYFCHARCRLQKARKGIAGTELALAAQDIFFGLFDLLHKIANKNYLTRATASMVPARE